MRSLCLDVEPVYENLVFMYAVFIFDYCSLYARAFACRAYAGEHFYAVPERVNTDLQKSVKVSGCYLI
jgi:hypothetical protein